MSPYDEAQARIRELLRPYAGHVDRETARRRLMDEDAPLRAVCPHCGRMKGAWKDTCRSVGVDSEGVRYCCFRDHEEPRTGQHARDREDYLVDEIAADEKSIQSWFRDWLAQWSTIGDLQERLFRQGELTEIVTRMYREAADRADKWKRRARRAGWIKAMPDVLWRVTAYDLKSKIDGADGSRDNARRIAVTMKHDRDEARAALDAMTTRARGMREALDKAYFKLAAVGHHGAADDCFEAAGEPIP